MNIYLQAIELKKIALNMGYNITTKLIDDLHYARISKDGIAHYVSVPYEPKVSDVNAIKKAYKWIVSTDTKSPQQD